MVIIYRPRDEFLWIFSSVHLANPDSRLWWLPKLSCLIHLQVKQLTETIQSRRVRSGKSPRFFLSAQRKG